MSEQVTDWSSADLTGDPHIVLGKRRGQQIDAVRLDVHVDLHKIMRTVCQKAIYDIATTEPRNFDPYASLEKGEEHFRLSKEDIRRLHHQLHGTFTSGEASGNDIADADSPEGDAEEDEDPALIACLANPVRHRTVERARFHDIQPFFYAISFQQPDGSWLSFIRKTNPQQFFKLGRIWCQYADTLKRVDEEPTFALDPTIDVVLHRGRLVGFSETALKLLFTDAKLSRSAVPAQVEQLRSLIKEDLPLTDSAAAALIAAGARRNTLATRIYGLSARLAELKEANALSVDRFREIARDDQEAMKLLNSEGHMEFGEDQATTFLDFLEGRYFEDDWTGAPMRADRLSKRR